MDLSHLTEHEEKVDESKDLLEKITELGQDLIAHKEELEELEDLVKNKKKAIEKIEQDLLPKAMISLNIKKFELSSGYELSIKEELACSVKNYEKLYDFLEDQGDDALMKTTIEVGKLPKNIQAKVLAELKEVFGLEGIAKMYIHPQTLKAYFKRLCGIGTDTEAKIPLAAVDEEIVNTYTYYKVSIKK